MPRNTPSKTITAFLLLALLVLPIGLYLTNAQTQGDGTLPNINKAAIPNPLLNIGPGLPTIVMPGETFTIILKQDYADNAIASAKLLMIKLDGDKLSKVTVDLTLTKVNDTVYSLTLPQNVESGLYDLILLTSNGKTLVSARSVWVINSLSELGNVLRFQHMSDVHWGAGTPDPTIGQNRRFTALLFSQLVGVNAILITGDEADTQASSQYENSLAFRYMLAYPVPLILDPGNHDYPNGNFIKYYEQTHGYVVFPGKLLIVFINTDGERGYPDWSELVFLKNTLEKYKDIPYKIVMMHHPVFYHQGEVKLRSDADTPLLDNPKKNKQSVLSYYWGANTTAARYFLSLCEDYNITLVLAGHIHRDQYVIFHSTRTNTTTLFETTTTLAHGTGTYQGLQVFEINLENGNISYPLAPPWFVGYKNVSRYEVYNAIPITLPQYTDRWKTDLFDNITFYGVIAEGKKALVFHLINNLPYLDINKTVLLALPWPADYTVNLQVLDSTGGDAQIVDQLRVDELNRTFVAVHINLPHNSAMKLAFYTVEDNEPPEITLKATVPKEPAVNKTVKLYIQVSDPSWGVQSATANITTTAGEVKAFKFNKYGGDTYLAQFTVQSKTQATVTLKVAATDFAGHTTTKTITIELAGPAPTTTTTTQTTTTATGAQTTTTTTETTTTTTGGGGASIIVAVIIAIVVIAIIALVVRR